MTPRRRSRSKAGWPAGLFERGGYYSWRNPLTREEYGLGRDRASAFAQAVEANLEVLSLRQKERLVDRMRGDGPRTVVNWFERYDKILAKKKLADNTRRAYRSLAKGAAAALGAETRLRSITALHVAEKLEALAESGKARLAQAMASFLRESFREAIVQGWLDQNPVRDLRRARVEVRRDRLTFETFSKLYDGTDLPWLRNAMALAVVSAQRREDIALATFADFHDGGWYCVQRKTGSRIFLPNELKLDCFGLSLGDVVRQCRASGVLSRHLIHQTTTYGNSKAGSPIFKDTVSKRFTAELTRLRLAAGAEHAPTFHEIRSLSARLYDAQGGIDTQQLLGHRNAKTTEIYRDARGQWVRLKVGTV